MRIFLSLSSGLLVLAILITHCTNGQAQDPRLGTLRSLPSYPPAASIPSIESSGKTDSELNLSSADSIRPLPPHSNQVEEQGISEDPVIMNRVSRSDDRHSQTRRAVIGFTKEFSEAYDSINYLPDRFDESSTGNLATTSGQIESAEATTPQIPLLARLPDDNSEFTNKNNFSVETPALIVRPNEPVEIERPTIQIPPDEFDDTTQLENIANKDPLWWKQLVNQPLNERDEVEPTDTNTLVYTALKNSPRIQAISKNPLIRDLQVTEAESEFDVVSFLTTQFDDRNDPVGNTLTTGGAPFLQDNIWFGEGGLRKKLATGADLELGQRMGFQNSNSRFFVPQDQGTATLSLNFTQPLLRRRGRYYNQSQILIAQSAGGVAWEAFRAELQLELEAVVEAYWRLYFHRSVYLQKQRNVSRGEMILDLLLGRSELDSLPTQITRARSAVLSRKTDLVSAVNDIRNSETEIRRLIADPNWISNQEIELLPLEPAMQTQLDQSLVQVVETALANRPEIQETLQRAKIAAIQYDVSTNELLPELSLLLNGYISALEGDSGIELALQRQFKNTPGYTVGFEFEFPIHNRAARSRQAQRDVQRSKIGNEVNETMQDVIADAQLAYRRHTTAYQTMDAAKVAIEAARMDLAQNHQRWASFALIEGDLAEGQSPTIVLDQLLDSQDRLAIAEFVFAQAELEFKISEVGLRRVTGTLLTYERVSFSKYYENNTPSLDIERDQ